MKEAAALARFLRELGCELALDDFGTGFASFYYLKRLPFRYIKIDGTFVQNLRCSSVDQVIVKAMVEATVGLGKKSVAEWVEDEATLPLLRQYGVNYAQGNCFGRPAPADEVLEADRFLGRRTKAPVIACSGRNRLCFSGILRPVNTRAHGQLERRRRKKPSSGSSRRPQLPWRAAGRR